MAKLYVDSDKFGYQAASPTVEAFHSTIKDIVRTKLAKCGGDWGSFVFDKSYDLITFSFEHADAKTASADKDGRELRGIGDNVAKFSKNTIGVAHYIRSPDQVLKYLTEGVPADAIAVIDDSGGTLTAPILEHFKGVICAGGSTRSHLGILTREYGVPCLMNAKISGIRNGDPSRLR